MTKRTEHPEKMLTQNATAYFDGLHAALQAGIDSKHLDVPTATNVALTVASAVAAQLDHDGIQLFEELAAGVVENMRRSKKKYDDSTNRH